MYCLNIATLCCICVVHGFDTNIHIKQLLILKVVVKDPMKTQREGMLRRFALKKMVDVMVVVIPRRNC